MAKGNNAAPQSALHEVLKWAKDKPLWQQDALRRIVAKPALDQKDVEELHRLCLAGRNTDKSTDLPIVPQPLDLKHLGPGPGAASAVSLISLSGLQKVGRIPSDQSLAFSDAPGLTIIYGDNGTGKSGFARVLKKACKTRGQVRDIVADAFAPPSPGPASASIACRVGEKDVPVSWKDGAPVDPNLAQIFVFDHETASHYVAQDESAAFTPHGLDVLPRLVRCSDAISKLIQADVASIEAVANATAANWSPPKGTMASTFIAGISHFTTMEQIEAHSSMDDKQIQRLKELAAALKDDPVLSAKKTRDSASRLRVLALKVSEAEKKLSDQAVATLQKLMANAASTAEAANSFASTSLSDKYLPGTGGEIWRKMWEAARAFSDRHAYEGKSFPHTTEAARCVLCQRSGDDHSLGTFKALEAFCKDASQELAAAAASELVIAFEAMKTMQPLAAAAVDLDVYSDVASAESRNAVADFVSHADKRLAILQTSLTSGTWSYPPVLTASPSAILSAMDAALDARAKTLESAADAAQRVLLQAEHDELAGREWLKAARDSVVAQVGRLKEAGLLAECKKDTQSGSATIKSKELAEIFVTGAFTEAFQSEVKALGLKTINVVWEKVEGQKGVVKFGPRLVGTSGRPVGQIASEGEQRCIALAAFLAELSQAAHKSALVFDDPVSSLDQRHRLKIAERLVAEAGVRQVIVFSHDLLFVHDLMSLADRATLTPHVQSLEWSGGKPGTVIDGLSWDCSKPKERLNDLRKIQHGIAASWNPVPNSQNVEEMREAYSKLRATMEGIIEREMLACVVRRFESQVFSGKLKHLLKITQAEVTEAERILKRCHETTEAHYTVPGKHPAIPDPNDLLQDIDAAEKIRKDAAARNKT